MSLHSTTSSPVLPIPFLERAAKEALPSLVAAPRLHDFRQVSANVLPPPALRMFSPNSSAYCSPFAPVVGTFTPTPSVNVVKPSGLQVVPSLMPAYMTLRYSPSVPRLQRNVATTISSQPTFRPAVPVTNFPRPPPLRLQLPSTSSVSASFQRLQSFQRLHLPRTLSVSSSFQQLQSFQRLQLPNTSTVSSSFQRFQLPSISSLSSSFQLLRSIFASANSVQPPPLQSRLQNMSQRSSAPASVVSSSQTVRPPLSAAHSARPAPLQIRLSHTAPYSSVAGDFSCFAISSTKPTVIGSIVSVAISSATQSLSSTSGICSQVSSAVSTSCSTRRTNIDVIEVDDDDRSQCSNTDVIDVDGDSSSEQAETDTAGDNDVESSSSESSPVASRMEVVSPSSTVSCRSVRLTFFQSNNHFQSLHAGVDCLQHIFQYLDVSSRLRAAQVCRCWHRMALQQHLVNSVKFISTNMCIIFSRLYGWLLAS